MRQRLAELAGVLDERLYIAKRHAAGSDLETADDSDEHVVQISNELDGRHDDPGKELSTRTCGVERLILFSERCVGLLLMPENLHQSVPGVYLFDRRVQMASLSPLLDKQRLRALGNHRCYDDRQWDGDKRD